MNRNTPRARAVAIAQTKADNKLVAMRYVVLAVSAAAATIALLVARSF